MKLAAVASVALALALVAGLAGRAAAQPSLTPPSSAPFAAPLPDPEEPPPPQRALTEAPLSEGTALGLSLGGTIASWLLIGAAGYGGGQGAGMMGLAGGIGVMFAPSFGHWYAGTYATRGLGLRVAALGTVVAGAIYALAECPLFDFDEDRESTPCTASGGTAIMIAGAGLFVAGTIDDIITAPGRARRHNERISGLALAPVITGRSAGLALGGRF